MTPRYVLAPQAALDLVEIWQYLKEHAAGVMASDAAAEDQGEFVGLTNGAIGVEEPLLESIDGGATTEDQIVAKFYLREKQSVLNPSVRSLLGRMVPGLLMGGSGGLGDDAATKMRRSGIKEAPTSPMD